MASIIIKAICEYFPNCCASENGQFACMLLWRHNFTCTKMFCSGGRVADIQKISVQHPFIPFYSEGLNAAKPKPTLLRCTTEKKSGLLFFHMHCNNFPMTVKVKGSIKPLLPSAMAVTCFSLLFKQGENIWSSTKC